MLLSSTEMIVATAILSESALAAGEAGPAERHLASLRELLNERGPSPRSNAAIRRLRDRSPMITTVITTQVH